MFRNITRVAMLIAAVAFIGGQARAQFVIPPKAQVQAPNLAISGSPPAGTGCTIANGSTDQDGTCTATAASGAIVFAFATFVNPPMCIVVDSTATPIMVFTVTALQITLQTITSGHIIRWHCTPQAGY